MVGEDGERTPLQQESEVLHGSEGREELPVEGGVFLFSRIEFLGEKGKRGPGPSDPLLKHTSYVALTSIRGNGKACTRDRVLESGSCGQGRLGGVEGDGHSVCPREVRGLST